MSDCEHSVGEVMENLAVGDELTIEDEYDIRRNREVQFFDRDRYAQFGDPTVGPWMIDTEQATFHELDADGSLGIGKEIVDVLYWDGEIDEDSGDSA